MEKSLTKTIGLAATTLLLLGSAGVEPQDSLIQQAQDLLRTQLNKDSEIRLQSFDWVTWSNAALGCPQTDRMYAQVLMEGYRIIFLVDGQSYAFHGSRDNAPFYCANPQPPVAVGKQSL